MSKFMKDKELIEKIKSGEVDFSVLYNKYHNYVMKSFINKGITLDEFNDLYQESMIALYYKIMNSDIELTCKLSTFIYSMVKNKRLKLLEKKSKNIDIFGMEMNNSNLSYSEEYNEEDVKMTLIKNIINNFSFTEKKIFEMLLSDYSTKEIKEKMNYSNLDSLKSAKARLLRKIKNEILLNK